MDSTALLECGACKKTLQDPRLLPCAHSFCFACVEQCARGNTSFLCPTCKASVTVPTDGSWFPENVFAVTMIRMAEQMRALTSQVSRSSVVLDTPSAASVDASGSGSQAVSPVQDSGAMPPTANAADGPMCVTHPQKVEFVFVTVGVLLCVPCARIIKLDIQCVVFFVLTAKPLEFFCKGRECLAAVCSVCLVACHQGPGHTCVMLDSASDEIRVYLVEVI